MEPIRSLPGNLAILFAAVALAACGSAPERPVETQPSARIIDASPGQARREAKAAASAAAPVVTLHGGGFLEGDGPGTDAPANLDDIPDAAPRLEPLNRFANRPYVALGQTFTPLDAPGHFKERGIASWYGKKFNGQRTSSGEVYDMYAMTAAHPTLPIPSYARVTNLANQKSVIVRINDRGPFLHDRIIDLSYTAAHKLGLTGAGSGEVEVESIAVDSGVSPFVAADPVESAPLPPAAASVQVAQTAQAVPAAAQAVAAPAAVYLQLGAFKSQQSAESFLAKMRPEFDGSGVELVLYQKDEFTRVHLGPYASAEEARAMAEKLQARLGFKPVVSVH